MNEAKRIHSKDRNCSVIILAGGNSSRMNFPKAWLPFSKKISILEHIIDVYAAFNCEQIVVVLNEQYMDPFKKALNKIEKKAIIVPNNSPEKGRIHSLKLGINSLNRNGMTFIHNVDNPEVKGSTLLSLLESNPIGFARPVYSEKGGHPILVTNGVLENILLSEEDIILKNLLTEHSKLDVLVNDSKVLLNINTPAEYTAYFGMEVSSINGNNYAEEE